MQILTNAASGDIGYVRMTEVDYMTVHLNDSGGDWDTNGTVTLSFSPDNGTTWNDYCPDGDGVQKVYTAMNIDTVLHWGNGIMRFTVGGGSGSVDVSCWVGGKFAILPSSTEIATYS